MTSWPVLLLVTNLLSWNGRHWVIAERHETESNGPSLLRLAEVEPLNQIHSMPCLAD